MRRHAATDLQGPAQERAPCPPLPADHVLGSGAVLFPGAFDQHGCPLVLFPVEGQDKLCSGLSKAEVVEFIHYFQYQHNRKQEKHSLVSAVADLRDASPSTTSFISETLLLLELHKRTVHTVYIVQPRRKDADKLLLKTLAPSKSSNASFKRVLLKEIPELQNYIDRSQLPWSLGGYFMYRHQSWVAFIKEIDAFVQKFLSVVQRLPSCISTLQALSKLPLPTAFSELRQFCATNEAKFQQLRRELGLDELLLHCESVVEKLRYPDREPCYQDMAGTALFTQTAFEMLQNHSRITAAVEKVELLWQQIFLKARLQLQVFQLREDALQITEKIETLLQEKIQPYKVQIAKDATKAAMLVSEFEASIHTPAVALVRWAEDVIHTLAELLPLDSQPTECWALDLERLKEKLDSAVNFILQTLRAVSSYHRYYNKASCWYSLVLSQNFLQELLSGVPGDAASTQLQRKNRGTIPAWRYRLATFLKKNRPPEMEELLYLSHLGHAIPDDAVQRAGKQMSQRCLTLRKLLISSEPLAVGQLQLALQWQYEFLRSGHGNQSSAATHTSMSAPHSPAESNPTQCEGDKDASHLLGTSPSAAVSRMVSSEDTPPSFSSFDSGFDGAGSSPLEVPAGRERLDGESRLAGTRDFANPALSSPHVHENISPYCEDHIKEFDVGTAGISSRPGIQIIPKADSLNLEIKVKRSAALPNNPWLSLPVDDLENSYTVTITQNPAPQKGDLRFHDSSDAHAAADLTDRCRARPTRREDLSGTDPRGPQSRDWMLRSQTSVEDPELSPVSNVLSSTINEGRDESSCSTEGIPTLLWDSYDLHDQNPLDADGEISLKDWDVKEQEGLKEVKMILDRTDEILEEEENVLAQEAVLDTLLRSEDTQGLWRLCDSEGQFGSMSSDELAEAGVLGFEDCLDSAHPNGLGDLLSAESAGETKAAGGDELHAEAPRVSDVSNCRPDLLTELRKVHMLDELIMEESMKIRELRRSKEKAGAELSGSKPVGVSKEREAFHLQLEEEKREVEKLEKSLEEECKDKKHSAEEVVTCPRTEKVDGALPRSQRLSVLVQSKSENAHKTEGDAQTFSGPDVTRGASPQDLDQLPLPQSQDVGDTAVFDLKEEVGIQTHQSVHEKEWDTSGEGTSLCSPEASLTPEMSLDDGAFDPGGKSLLLPEPEPRKASLPVNYGLAELDAPHSAEVLKSARSSAERDPHFKQFDPQDDALEGQLENVPPDSSRLILNPNVKEHCNNNNNNHVLPENCGASLQPEAKISPENEEAASVEATRSLQPAERIHASPPADEHQLTPAQPLEFDPGGGDERNEKLPDGVQAREALRTPHSGSPGSQSLLYSHRREMSDFESPIVLDTGSGLMKAGFADRDHPNVIFPTIIGVPKYEEVLNGDLEREAYIGHGAQHMRGVLTLRHPIKNGIICNWDEMEQVWHHTFQQLRVEPEDHPVLLTEAAMNPRENRQHMVEIMFERFNVPLAYMAMQAVLALYAAGRTTGVVFDSGDGVSHSVPVFEGYCLPHAVQRFPLAGSDVTLHLKKLLQEQGVCMRTTAEEEIVREMKEECCCVALNYEDELSRGGSSCREMHYTMPDGQIVALSTERFRAPEILFKPELIGRDHDGMHKSIFKSILSSDIDLRRCFLGNIILSGGNTLLPGLPERLQAEIKGLLPADARESVRVTSPTDRDFSVWRGGAVLASLPTMTSAWISQEEYEEYGPQIVFRKCF